MIVHSTGEVELPPLDLATRLELLRAVDEEVVRQW